MYEVCVLQLNVDHDVCYGTGQQVGPGQPFGLGRTQLVLEPVRGFAVWGRLFTYDVKAQMTSWHGVRHK